MKTYTPKANDLKEKWFVVDAEGQTLGRLAARIAYVLRGKNTPRFTPHANMHHHVVVVNADKVKLTGKKWDEKMYYRATGWVGNLRQSTARELHAKKPTEMLRLAVKGMLPHTRLGDATMKHLRLYAGPEHPHDAQKPVQVELTN
ncbi:50S ribosomal protein L13 [bacterium]|nr:50S ribosomal protein L13 [bacterium]